MTTRQKSNWIKENKSIALLSPSSKTVFEYPAIIGMLKSIGFNKVGDLSLGIKESQKEYANFIKSNPGQKLFISSSCPAATSFIQKNYPEFAQYLVCGDSPMAAAAKICKKKYPKYKVVFVSPCRTKAKIEAPKYKEFIDEVLLFEELRKIFQSQKTKEENFLKNYRLDFSLKKNQLPVNLFGKKKCLTAKGVREIKKAIGGLTLNPKRYKHLDILFCEGGCGDKNSDLSFRKSKRRILLRIPLHP